MDYVLVSPPERILLLIVAFLHHHRAPLLCVTDLAQARGPSSYILLSSLELSDTQVYEP